MEVEAVAQTIVASIEPFVKAMIDEPDKLKISTVLSKQMILISIECVDADRGKIIGRRGSHADAIRTIVNAIAARWKTRAIIEIADTPKVI